MKKYFFLLIWALALSGVLFAKSAVSSNSNAGSLSTKSPVDSTLIPEVEFSEILPEYLINTDVEVTALVQSNGLIDNICGVGYELYKDGTLITNIADYGTLSFQIRQEGENYYNGVLTEGSGMIDIAVAEDHIGAFTLGMFDNYCVDRNRPINFTANLTQAGVYKMVSKIYSCTNAGTKTLASFTATNCDSLEHFDMIAATCENPTELSTQEVIINVNETLIPVIEFTNLLPEYTTNTDVEVTALVQSNGLIDTLCGVGYELYKDGTLITNIADYGTLSFQIRQEGENYYNGVLTEGSGMIDIAVAEDHIGAFTLGMFDNYCVDRNRPINFTANLTQAGVYKMVSKIYSCTNAGTQTGTSFTAINCDGLVHADMIAATCENPTELSTQEVIINVNETLIPVIEFTNLLPEYTTNTDVEVTALVQSNGLIDTLCGVGYELYKDGTLITNIADYGTLSFQIRQEGENYYNGVLTEGSGMIDIAVAEDHIGAFTLGMFDNYCVDRNRPINFTANLTQAGVYKMVSKIYSCTNAGTQTETSFTAINCDGSVHYDMIAATCENPTELSTQEVIITVINPIDPIFSFNTEYCLNALATALPLTSDNDIEGTWSPEAIATDVAGEIDYVFTADAGQNASNVSITVTVLIPDVPTFDAVGPFCEGSTIAALPLTSTNGITGTWSPVIDNMTTTEYTFTPADGLCATTQTMTIVITPNVTPTFTAVGPFCEGSTIAALPLTSTNGITGTWSPAIDNMTTTEYTFTPADGLCATTQTMTIVITPNVTPTFTAVGPFCEGSTIADLPLTSTNGITGTWSPAINNAATTEYTYTPEAGECATTQTLTIVITPNVTPTFDAVGPFCEGSTIAALPLTSTNGITGTWSPAIDNMTTTEYTFTPADGLCATTQTMTIVITPNVTPTFTAVGPFCEGSTIAALPLTSTNGITGTWSPVIDNMTTTEYTFTPADGLCATTQTMTIVITPNVTPTFTAVGPFCEGSTIAALPLTSTNGITGTWSPVIDNMTTTEYTFTPADGLCATTQTMTIVITPNVTPTFTAVGPFCEGSTIADLPLTSTNGITGTWSPAINNAATTEYTYTPEAGECATTQTLTIVITPNVTPTFDAVGPFCEGSTIAALPLTSTNGITGTWSPAIDNMTTTEYTFTPADGLCATTQTMTIVITPNVTPTFTAVGPFCEGSTIAALPLTSTNGITGTWSPAIDNMTTTEYTFTPADGLCATTQTMTIVITPNVTPTFTAVGPFCEGSTIAALPLTSTNGITGTWSPVIDNMTTTEYTFTPADGLCATTQTMTIVITPNVTPTFTAVGPFCEGSTIAALPLTSTNGITGTWSPAINNAATTEYTFTPADGLCATTQTMTIVITPNVTPTFTAVGPFCEGSTIAALPLTSTNGITGTWSPVIDNMTTTEYTFTPTDGLCATTQTMTIVITPNVTPTFTAVGPFCEGSTIAALPLTSTNGITGTWSPAIDNMTTTEYTFTPADGLCATTQTMTIVITPNVTPTFTAVGPFCEGSTIAALPLTSTNGITGTWSPVIDNMTTTEYTFTPADGLCATTQTMTIVITPNVTPTFTAVGPFCEGSTIAALPLTSTNGITGTWSPVIDNMTTTEYTFTPADGLCATTQTMTIVITPNIVPTFSFTTQYCLDAVAESLPLISDNGVAGSWNPLTIATNVAGDVDYVFTADAGQCAADGIITVTVADPIVPTFSFTTQYCLDAVAESLPLISDNGVAGSWNPLTIATNVAGDVDYVFTADAGQCATDGIITVTVADPIVPTFSFTTQYCLDAVAESLPLISDNGVAGSWNPSTIATNVAGDVDYVFTADAGQCAANPIIVVTINALPEVTCISDFIMTVEDVFALCGSFPAGGTYSGIGVTNNNFNSISLDDGNYTITYDYTDPITGCSNSCEFVITVDIASSIHVNEIATIGVYPNPNKGVFTIGFANIDGKANYQIYDAKGSVIVNKNIHASGNATEDVSLNLVPGVYFIKVVTTNQTIVEKLVIQ